MTAFSPNPTTAEWTGSNDNVPCLDGVVYHECDSYELVTVDADPVGPSVPYTPSPSGDVTRKVCIVAPCEGEGGGGGEQNGTIYWGMAPSGTYSPFDFDTWDQATQDNFLALMDSEVGDYRSGSGYEMLAADPLSFGWFIVPNSYATPISETGFEFGFGAVGAPTDDVLTAAEGNDAQANSTPIDAACNGFVGASGDTVNPGSLDDNGWNYFVRNIDGVTYRFYPFCVVIDQFDTLFYGTTWWFDGVSPDEFTLFVTD